METGFSGGDDRPLRTPWHDTIIYELHVKGFTCRHPDVPGRLRGTYAGLATEPVIAHLKRPGISAGELMPVHAFVDYRGLLEKVLRIYLSYNSIRFSAPSARYSISG